MITSVPYPYPYGDQIPRWSFFQPVTISDTTPEQAAFSIGRLVNLLRFADEYDFYRCGYLPPTVRFIPAALTQLQLLSEPGRLDNDRSQMVFNEYSSLLRVQRVSSEDDAETARTFMNDATRFIRGLQTRNYGWVSEQKRLLTSGAQKYLYFYSTSNTDGIVAQFAGMPEIEKMYFELTDLSNAGFQHVAELPNLRELMLDATLWPWASKKAFTLVSTGWNGPRTRSMPTGSSGWQTRRAFKMR